MCNLKILPPNKKKKLSEEEIKLQEIEREKGNHKRKLKNIKRKANKEEKEDNKKCFNSSYDFWMNLKRKRK